LRCYRARQWNPRRSPRLFESSRTREDIPLLHLRGRVDSVAARSTGLIGPLSSPPPVRPGAVGLDHRREPPSRCNHESTAHRALSIASAFRASVSRGAARRRFPHRLAKPRFALLRVGRRMSHPITRHGLRIAFGSKFQRRGRSGSLYRFPATRVSVRLADPPEVRRHDVCTPGAGPVDDGTRKSTTLCLRRAPSVSRPKQPLDPIDRRTRAARSRCDLAKRWTGLCVDARSGALPLVLFVPPTYCRTPRMRCIKSPAGRSLTSSTHHGIQFDPTPGPRRTQSNSVANHGFVRPSRPRHRLVSARVQFVPGVTGR
jgi:hypothetical protein